MPTEPGKVIIDEPFHVCHRGNNREAIFGDDQDRLRWGGRYRSWLLDRHHRWIAMDYVEQNPVRARMVAAAVDWPWSSARQHCLGGLPDVTLRLDEWRMAFTREEWSAFLTGDRRADDDLLRVYTENSWALGESAWVARLEQICGRPLRPMPSGVHRLPSSTP